MKKTKNKKQNNSIVLSETMFSTVWAVENDLSRDALVAGFTNISLHTEKTSLISFLSGVGNSLILNTKDINLQ